MDSKKIIISGMLIAAVIGGIFYLDSKKVSRNVIGGKVEVKTTANKEEKTKKYPVAKEMTTPDGFINTGLNPDGSAKTISIGEFVGKKVVLLDIWTYSCINCKRTTPYLNAWYEKYKDDGLVIIGLHTPEFEFEKVYENVLAATQRLQIKYPVVLDNDYSTWNAYQNRFWPRKYLIDIDGFVVYDHIGEGGYEETEAKIIELLNERSARLGTDAVVMGNGEITDVEITDFSKIKTPEVYFGASRVQYLANLPTSGCKDGVCNFASLGNPALNTFELSGAWKINDEGAVLEGGGGSVFLRFSANKANLVAGATGNPVRAEIYLDGKKVPDETAGDAVQRGTVTFGMHDLYNLIDLKGNYGEHILEIRFLDSGVSAFAFTFG
ncbi:MAG: redoxin domain-containing protein [Patescibacteria group bacterium]